MLGIIRLKCLKRLLSSTVIAQSDFTTYNPCPALKRQVAVGTVVGDILIKIFSFVKLFTSSIISNG